VLEQGTVAVLAGAGADGRLRSEGLVHEGFGIAFDGRLERVNLLRHGGAPVHVYGQTEITRDLNELNLADGISLQFESPAQAVQDLDGDSAVIVYQQQGARHELHCDFVAGCDGFHGISRGSMPAGILREFQREYPVGWLGVLSETRPAAHELVYASHLRGFALCSQRSHQISRNYIEVPAEHTVEQWSDDAFWDELRRRLPAQVAETLDTGPAMEKSIARLRSHVTEPMRHGRLFLVGDAAHIVPPTGAKGLNLAVSDSAMLASALGAEASRAGSSSGTKPLGRIFGNQRKTICG
jgi:p-hydroxybenzoate 3-monooxygenase